ncbi:right-handed parallel beta-helix repeat-containing protein [Halodesulfurarchaeum sp. HSR-GB]|uniref:right-handed parallel beta-helix repeat-containing protein n=1 Tax=Halodesulfurarchaeum sp. HSR-GB TaxID=3074077 RepID=UPI00285DB720|nr:right-handed parallel beta-helix repeat-containing protein [Halodesulfurarchaeum sp. HSR-GB]MDR5656651.1 right-handed parallel beta-helix repeat-containing protein [Halodesulfurarchaeum sp. HSR-GB]
MSVSVRRTVAVFLLLGALVLLAVSAPAAAQSGPTTVEHNVTETTTWDGEYRIVSNVTVAENATLEIEPGTTVELAEGISLSVAGNLSATGSSEAPIRFRASKPAATGGAWDAIRTTGAGSATLALAHTELQHATDAIRIEAPGSTVRLTDSTIRGTAGDGIAVPVAGQETALQVRSSRFASIAGDGISVTRTTILPVETVSGWEISDTAFTDIEGVGLDLHATTVRDLQVERSDFHAVETGIRIAADQVRTTAIRSTAIEPTGTGIGVETLDVQGLSISENEITGAGTGVDLRLERNVRSLVLASNDIVSGDQGVAIEHDPRMDRFYGFAFTFDGNTVTDHTDNGLSLHSKLFADSSIAVRNNTASDNGGHGIGLFVGAFQDASVSGNELRKNGASGLSMTARHVRNTQVEDNLARANGESGLSITARQAMTGLRVAENELLDNAREGLAITNGVRTDGNYTIEENLLAANAYGIAASGPQRATIETNEIVFNTVAFGDLQPRTDADPGVGVLLTEGAAGVDLRANDIYGHRVALLTDVSGTVRAEANYWGAANGPYHRSINPEGEGNAVETRNGWVDLHEVSPDRHGPAYARPSAEIEFAPSAPAVDESIELSAAGSSDSDGAVRTYRYSVNESVTVTTEASLDTAFDAAGSYPITLWVEDDMGIESATPATATVTVEAAPTPTTTGQTQPPTTHPDPGSSAPLGLIGGLLGAGLYGMAVLLGARGLYQTLTESLLTVRGRRLHVLAGAGILTWGLASIPGPSILRPVAVAAFLVWVGLTGVAYLVVRLR